MPRPRRTGRVGIGLAAAVLGLVLALGPAAPAAADPPTPTDFRSTVVGAEPSLPDGVEVRVVGGDAFFELRVPRGTTAMVPDSGQEDEPDPRPYLRFLDDGTVERNDRSLAAAANEARYGTADAAPDPDAAPEWTVVATNGTYAWHDHRIHWMSPRTPTTDGDGLVDLGGPGGSWEVALVVDDQPITVRGELHVLPAPSPLPWFLLAVVACAGGLVLAGVGRRGSEATAGGRSFDVSSPRPLVVALALACLVGAGVSMSVWRSAPADAGATPVAMVVALVGALGALAAVVAPRAFRFVGAALAAAAAVGWSATRLDVLSNAILPGDAPTWVDRSATVAALGLGVAVAVVVAWRPARFRSSRSA